MNYNRILNNFVEKIMQEGTYASREQVELVAGEMLDIIKENKDSTPEELIDKAIEDIVFQAEDIRKTYPVPGYTIGIKAGNINLKLLGGFMDQYKRPMSDDALFDIASMSKFNTEIIAYNLIKDGAFSFSDKIRDLDPRFVNVGDLTVGDVLSFTTEFRTNGRIAEKDTIEEALNCLYTMNVVATGKYNYNDMGMMLMKELMERVTGKTYPELFSEYIGNKLKLRDTHLIVPTEKIARLTGSANASLGLVNDPSALAVGGYSGHAGIFSSNDDLLKLATGAVDGTVLSPEMLKDAYTPGVKDIRGIMGNTYTSHKDGINASYVDVLEAKTNFAIQGSTRVQMNMGKNSSSTILLNPASMSLDRAREEEAHINEKRSLKGLPPLKLVKDFNFKRDNGIQSCNLIDARLMVPGASTVEKLTTENAKLALKLRLLNEVVREYDGNSQKEINVVRRV